MRFKRALVDGDILAMRVGFAAAKGILDLRQAIMLMNNYIDTIAKNDSFECDNVELYYTGKGPKYREKFNSEYKATRKRRTGPRPLWVDDLKSHFGGVVSNSEWGEADDLIAAEHMRIYNSCYDPFSVFETLIVSSDKDFLQLPGFHARYIFAKEKSTEVTYVGEVEATRNFYTQMLVGDVSDNIAGVPGIGPARAKRILEDLFRESDMFDAVLDRYVQWYYFNKSNDEITDLVYNTGNLLYLRRGPDDVWTPPLAGS